MQTFETKQDNCGFLNELSFCVHSEKKWQTKTCSSSENMQPRGVGGEMNSHKEEVFICET